MTAEMGSNYRHKSRNGFQILSDDVGYDIVINVRYDHEKTNAKEVLTALAAAYTKAFDEVESRLGKVEIE